MPTHTGAPQRSPSTSRVGLIATALLVAVAVGAALLYARNQSPATNSGNASTATNLNISSNSDASADTNASPAPPGWTTYTDSQFGFSFSYPPNWRLTTYPDGTLSVVPPSFQEPVPLMKAVAGDADAGVVWLNANRSDPGGGPFTETTATYALGASSGPVYGLGGNAFAVVLPIDGYTMIAYLNPTQRELPFDAYYLQYRQILDSFSLTFADPASQITVRYPVGWETVATSYATVGFRPMDTQIGVSEWSAIYLSIRPNPHSLTLETFYAQAEGFVDLFEVSPTHEQRTVERHQATYFPVVPGAVANAALAFTLGDQVIEVQMHRDQVDEIPRLEERFLGIAASVM